MGGVAGHMDHLYENRDLTFGEMKEILEAAANGELTAEEKVDGQNLFLSYSIPEGKAKGARNKGNLKSGGLDATGLAQKFAGRGNLEKAFTGGFRTFEKAVEVLSDEEKERIFGPNTNIWYNAEVMDPGNANVILYDDKTLKIHDVGHFIFDRDNGEQSPIPEGTLETLDNALERMEQRLHKDDFRLARRAMVDIKKIEDDGETLNKAISKINNEMRREGLNDDSTIVDYMFKRLMNGMDSDLPPSLREEIVNYILKLPGNIGLRALKKGLNPQDLRDLNSLIASSKSLLQQSVEPLEIAIHDFTVDLLKGLESVFIADNEKEVVRLKSELSNAVREITNVGAENPEAMAVMQRHLNKIKDFSMITTPVEAVVFDYNGHTYKFAGNFAPLNQILGMFRYGNLKRSTKESLVVDKPIITEKENNIKKERAKQFVLNLPKFSPNESWGKPQSMERKQVEKIFATISGGASIQAKFDDIIGRANFDTNMRAPRRIISTLIFLESLSAVINSFTESSAGFVFEGFLAAMFSGKQVIDPDDGSKPIEDIVAFSTLEGNKGIPVSLKLLKEDGTIKGSFTNLVEALNTYPEMLYIVTRKLGDEIQIQQFAITRDNVIELLTSGKQEKAKYELFGSGDKPLVYPGKRTDVPEDLLAKYDRKLVKYKNNVVKQVEELKKLYAAAEWPVRYELLKNTYGYSAQKRDAMAAKYEKAKKEKEARLKQQDTQATQPEEETQPVENNPELAEEGLVRLTIEEQRELWKTDLLTEDQSAKGRSWSLSVKEIVPDTKKGTGISSDISGFKILGNLPVSTDRIVAVAENYMDVLEGSIEEIFKATKNLSDDIDGYFTYGDRSDAITAGDGAIKNSEIIAQEMKTQVAQDKTAPAQRNESLNTTAQVITEKEGKRIALFPGKFKPPHRGHFDYVNKIAKRSDVDEVIVLISPVDYPEVSNAQSLRIWEEYLENGEPNITAKIADYRSPVQAVYEFVADPDSASDGDTVLLVKSSKDVGDTRFDRAQSYAERHNPGVNVEDIIEDPVQSRAGIVYSARDMRKAIADGDKETFVSYIPPNADADAIWAALTTTTEDVTNFIDTAIEEMSGMAGGAVGGYSGGGTVNIRKRSKNERPKVRRAKRQRRR